MTTGTTKWFVLIGLVLIACSGCDPVGRGLVREPVPESQLRRVQHPTDPVHWFPNSLGPAASGSFKSVAVGDLDGDGLPDIAAGRSDRRGVQVWLANGDGTWSSVEGPPHLGRPTDLAIGNLRDDPEGLPDLVVAGEGELPGIRIYRNRLAEQAEGENGALWVEAESPALTQDYSAVILADINRNGRLDIIAARQKNGGEGGVGVWFNLGEDGWSDDFGPTTTKHYHDVAVADFNRDGHLDLVAARWGSPGGLDIWYGNSRGSWTRSVQDPPIKLNFQSVDVGDFNGNGEIDIIATSYRSDMAVCIFLNDRHGAAEDSHRQAGWWSTPVELAGRGSFSDVKAVDLNENGLLDVVATSFDERGIRCWLQLPTDEEAARPFVPRFLEQSRPFPPKGSYFAVTTADFNEDGRPDIVLAARGEGINVWFQTTQPDTPIAISPRTRSVPDEQWTPHPLRAPGRALDEPRENYVFTTMVSRVGREYTEYRIGPRDVLEIRIYPSRHADPLEQIREVKPSGDLLLPVVSSDPLTIVDQHGFGLTPTQLRELIQEKLAQQVFQDPAVSVTVREYAAHTASVLGEIRNLPNRGLTGPGQYVLNGRTRTLEFIVRHGGFTDHADLTRVEVRKETGEKRVINLFKAIFQSELEEDVLLDRGDTVYIPSIRITDRKVYVLGEVREPGVYQLDDPITLLESIQLAGSFLRSANRRQVIVIRGDRDDPEFLQINMLDILREGDLSKNIPLKDADIVYVPSNWIANVREFYSWFLPGFDRATDRRYQYRAID